jgi:hypothetical protein
MNRPTATFDIEKRRAGIRRTALALGGVALAIFLLFCASAVWHA